MCYLCGGSLKGEVDANEKYSELLVRSDSDANFPVCATATGNVPDHRAPSPATADEEEESGPAYMEDDTDVSVIS